MKVVSTEGKRLIPLSIQHGLTVAVTGLALVVAGAAFTKSVSPTPAPMTRADSPRFFEDQIAPLLARHCLECHDSSNKQGGLDLSSKAAALAGGKNGKAIVPGKSGASLLWTFVHSSAMPPKDRPPLSPQEKQLLQRWIDSGAVWPGNAIDPLALTRSRRSAENWLRRLTVPEYVETVRSAVGVEIEPDARRILPPDIRADGFSNTAYNLTADLRHVEAYARLAEIIVGKMDVKAFAARYAKSPNLTDSNMRALIAGMGKWLLRGPLQEREIQSFLRVSTAIAKDGGTFTDAAGGVLEAMLQSPRFLYRMEIQRGDGKPRPANPHELASRMSYILWGGPPDPELMRAADAGELSDKAKVAEQVQRMLRDPRAVRRSSRFLHDWLDLDRLGTLRPTPARFPTWDHHLAVDMRNESLAFFEEVAWKQKRPLADLMNAQVAFLTPRLADHYGLAPKLNAFPRKGDLQALYVFKEGGGDTLRDLSGAKEPLDLKIEDTKTVKWEAGRLSVNAPALIATPQPPKRLIQAVKASKAVTMEAWITPAARNQTGPARIVSLSSGASERNFTLGQDGDKFELRLRGGNADGNGMPGLTSAGGSAEARLTHVAFTRDPAGKVKLYVNGEEMASRDSGGDLSSWNEGYRLMLANESTKDRAWRGKLHLVALYSRALSPEEIMTLSRGPARYDLQPVPARGGLLTQGAVLTKGGEEASMVTRGLFVLKDLLYSAVGSAPPGTDTTPIHAKPGMSVRAVAMTRLNTPSCAGCHKKFEPLAFGLEKFDGLGSFMEVDRHGNKLREDGEILFPGESKPVPFKTVSELTGLLAESDRVKMNMTRKVTQFALGRPLVESDAPILTKIHAAAQKGGGTYAGLITSVVMSDLVQMTRTEAGK
ncbi:MAG: DUF1592 domain-containing protein [Armatimonadetes bacterium]|nr:DUF1592 domain-containing protein [Armatimonadota bacterium]